MFLSIRPSNSLHKKCTLLPGINYAVHKGKNNYVHMLIIASIMDSNVCSLTKEA